MAKDTQLRCVTPCIWCGRQEESYGGRARCPRCRVLYSNKLDYMYFVNALRDVLRVAPLETHKPRDLRKLAS